LHDCSVVGVERDPEATIAAIRRGVDLIALDIDTELGEFADSSYDVVVLSQTLQSTQRPDMVLREVARIAPRCILSVPNFGLLRHRFRLAVRGRMPMSAELPYTWYRTPNIHLSTLRDLEALLPEVGLAVERRILLDEKQRALRSNAGANLRAASAIYALHRVAAATQEAGRAADY
jgi:methionine biosynthesis protein MetW